MDDSKKHLSVNLKMPRVIVFFILIQVTIMIFAYYFTIKPNYLKLDPPFPDGVLARIEEEAIITWYNGMPAEPSSNSYVWRKTFLIGAFDCGDDLKSQEQILDYLDNWLLSEGWKRWTEVGSPCAHMEQEDFLERGKDYYPYVPEEVTSLSDTPAVCVAVWPLDNDNTWFYALLATSNK